jgi:hypothetical protein
MFSLQDRFYQNNIKFFPAIFTTVSQGLKTLSAPLAINVTYKKRSGGEKVVEGPPGNLTIEDKFDICKSPCCPKNVLYYRIANMKLTTAKFHPEMYGSGRL